MSRSLAALSDTGRCLPCGGVEPTLGFEPRTCCLRNSCSTAELCRLGPGRIDEAIWLNTCRPRMPCGAVARSRTSQAQSGAIHFQDAAASRRCPDDPVVPDELVILAPAEFDQADDRVRAGIDLR